MEQNQAGLTGEKRADNDNRGGQKSASVAKTVWAKPKPETMGERWNATQFSKTAIFWLCIGVVAATMLVGFTWGGWVTDATAQKTATTLANSAVVARLSAICIAQYQQDGEKVQKLVELKALSSYQREDYVKKQTWAMMPGDEQVDSKVVRECAKQLAAIE